MSECESPCIVDVELGWVGKHACGLLARGTAATFPLSNRSGQTLSPSRSSSSSSLLYYTYTSYRIYRGDEQRALNNRSGVRRYQPDPHP